MSFTCELSGEPLQTIIAADGSSSSIVVTPSGHLCQRRLLLQKLAANGGHDPWDATRPLREDELIELRCMVPPVIMAPRSPAKSVQVTLQHLQQDYDAVLLELFDTRKLLAETREELSQALYQNDAAVRVVARMAAERDQARAAISEWNSNGGVGGSGGGPTTMTSTKRAAATAGEDDDAEDRTSAIAGPAKKVKVINVPLSALPGDDQKLMLETWERLSIARKVKHKAAAKAAPTPAQITSRANQKPVVVGLDGAVEGKLGVTALIAARGLETYVQVVSDQVHLLSENGLDDEGNGGSWTSKILCDLAGQSPPTAVSTSEEEESATSLLVGFADGSVVSVVGAANPVMAPFPTIDGQAIVSVALHPDQVHVIATTAGGHIAIGELTNQQWVTAFAAKPNAGTDAAAYTFGALHPDGLIYLAGRPDGSLDLWDFKNQTLAANLPNDGSGAVRALAFSSNGYHVAVAYENQEVLVWDLRKQSVLATLNTGPDALDKVQSVTFDAAGKYLAYAGVLGNNGNASGTTMKPPRVAVTVISVKQWNTTYSLHDGGKSTFSAAASDDGVAIGIVWNKAGIAVATAANNVAANMLFPL